jgi:hypothetical protein
MSRSIEDPETKRLMEHILSIHQYEVDEEISDLLLICEIIEEWMKKFNKTEEDAKKVYKKYGVNAFLSSLGRERVGKILRDYGLIDKDGKVKLE